MAPALIPHPSQDIRLTLWGKSYKENVSKNKELQTLLSYICCESLQIVSEIRAPGRAGTTGPQQGCLALKWEKLWWLFLVKGEWFSKRGTPSGLYPVGGPRRRQPPHPFPPRTCFLLGQVVAEVLPEPNSPWSTSSGAESLRFGSKESVRHTYQDHLPQPPVPMSKPSWVRTVASFEQ